MAFNIKNLGRTDLHVRSLDMEKEFSPMHTDFYSYAAAHGCGVCPTLVPTFQLALDSNNCVVGIETHLDTYWGFKEGMSQNIPEPIYDIFTEYMREKGFADDIFQIDTPEKASRFFDALNPTK